MRRPCLFGCCFCGPEPEERKYATKAQTRNLDKLRSEVAAGEARDVPPPATSALIRNSASGPAAASKYALQPKGPETQGLKEVGLDGHAQRIDDETRKQDQLLEQVMQGLDHLKAGALVSGAATRGMGPS